MDTRNIDWVSHRDYLASCSYDDLINLKRFVEERIKKVEAQEKFTIYAVEGTSIMEGYYENYQDAQKKLIEVAQGYDEYDCNDIIRIRRMKVYESELPEYLSYPKN